MGDLTPRGGSSEVGEAVTFALTWTVTGGKSWRALDHVDLKLADNAGTGLRARFYPGNPSTFALLDSNGNVVGVGVPGSSGTLESSTASLDLGNSSFDAAGPTSPTVTVNFVVTFKPAAARDASAIAARVYDTEISATDLTGGSQGPEQVGHRVVQP